MKKIYCIVLSAVAALFLLSCTDEWDPVWTLKYDDPGTISAVTLYPNLTISELKALYKHDGTPVHIEEDYVIGGQVTSDDRAGNVYRSLYIQDETGAIELKLGRTALYNDYRPGQWIYVKCMGLTIGNYNGMLQLGLEDASGTYETAYMLSDYLITSHVFKGAAAEPLAPQEVTEDEVKESVAEGFSSDLLGRYVTLKGLRYGDEIFALLYIDPSKDTKESSNRIFLSDETYGVKTWAMSKVGFTDNLMMGSFDRATSADNARKVSDPDLKEELQRNASPVTVSQYFLMGGTQVQIRTSGYSRFADKEIDAAVLSGEKTIDVTGILTNYQGAAQFTLLDEDGVTVN